MMTESKELHEKVDKILQRVESMDNFMPWLVRPQAKAILEEMKPFFTKRLSAVKVYLEVDGEKSVTAIAEKLTMKIPNVSREITVLREMGLIEPKSVGNATVYQKTKIDKIIGLSRELIKLIGKNEHPVMEGVKNEEQTADRDNSSV